MIDLKNLTRKEVMKIKNMITRGLKKGVYQFPRSEKVPKIIKRRYV